MGDACARKVLSMDQFNLDSSLRPGSDSVPVGIKIAGAFPDEGIAQQIVEQMTVCWSFGSDSCAEVVNETIETGNEMWSVLELAFLKPELGFQCSTRCATGIHSVTVPSCTSP